MASRSQLPEHGPAQFPAAFIPYRTTSHPHHFRLRVSRRSDWPRDAEFGADKTAALHGMDRCSAKGEVATSIKTSGPVERSPTTLNAISIATTKISRQPETLASFERYGDPEHQLLLLSASVSSLRIGAISPVACMNAVGLALPSSFCSPELMYRVEPSSFQVLLGLVFRKRATHVELIYSISVQARRQPIHPASVCKQAQPGNEKQTSGHSHV